jgi:hypothetical protein
MLDAEKEKKNVEIEAKSVHWKTMFCYSVGSKFEVGKFECIER